MSETVADLRPWAAYVLGHHAWTLRLLQELCWDSLGWAGREDEANAAALQTQLEETSEAIFQLGCRNSTDSSLHLEFGRMWELFSGWCCLTLEEETTGRKEAAPGHRDWERFVVAADALIPESNPYSDYYELGKLIGGMEHRLIRGIEDAAERIEFRTELLHHVCRPVMEVADRLGRDDLRAAAVEFRKSVDSFALDRVDILTWPLSQRSDAARLVAFFDAELRTMLRSDAPPPVLLSMTPEEIVFLGKSIRDAGRSSAIAMLWVLAEHAGEPVERSFILTDGGIDRKESGIGRTSEEGLKWVARNLRDLLKDAVDEYFGTDERPEKAERCFIKGHRRHGTSIYGPYELEIDRRQVRVGRRPDWMPRRRQLS